MSEAYNNTPRRGRPPGSGKRSAAVEGLLNQTNEDNDGDDLFGGRDEDSPSAGLALAAGKTRRRRRGHRRTGENRYAIDLKTIPSGMSYEWKRVSYLGKDDREHQIDLAENGFTPVPAERHPELAGIDGKGHIVREGLMLMERPKELRREAEEEDRDAARALRKQQFKRLGMTPDNNMPRTSPKGNRSFEPVADDGDEA